MWILFIINLFFFFIDRLSYQWRVNLNCGHFCKTLQSRQPPFCINACGLPKNIALGFPFWAWSPQKPRYPLLCHCLLYICIAIYTGLPQYLNNQRLRKGYLC